MRRRRSTITEVAVPSACSWSETARSTSRTLPFDDAELRGDLLVPARGAVCLARDARALGSAHSLRTVAPPLAGIGGSGAVVRRRDPRRGTRADARPPRRYRFRCRGGIRAPIPTRRDGAYLRLRRS